MLYHAFSGPPLFLPSTFVKPVLVQCVYPICQPMSSPLYCLPNFIFLGLHCLPCQPLYSRVHTRWTNTFLSSQTLALQHLIAAHLSIFPSYIVMLFIYVHICKCECLKMFVALIRKYVHLVWTPLLNSNSKSLNLSMSTRPTSSSACCQLLLRIWRFLENLLRISRSELSFSVTTSLT